MQQGFQHREITAAHLLVNNAPFGIDLDRLRRFPQQQPDVHAASAAQRIGLLSGH